MRKRTQKIMQAVPMWMPMTMLPREASPSLHWHRLFPPGSKHSTNEEHPHDRKKLSFGHTSIWHIFVAIVSSVLRVADIILRQRSGGPCVEVCLQPVQCESFLIVAKRNEKRYSSCAMSLFGILPRYNYKRAINFYSNYPTFLYEDEPRKN